MVWGSYRCRASLYPRSGSDAPLKSTFFHPCMDAIVRSALFMLHTPSGGMIEGGLPGFLIVELPSIILLAETTVAVSGHANTAVVISLLSIRICLTIFVTSAGSLCAVPAVQIRQGGQHTSQYIPLRQASDCSWQLGEHLYPPI